MGWRGTTPIKHVCVPFSVPGGETMTKNTGWFLPSKGTQSGEGWRPHTKPDRGRAAWKQMDRTSGPQLENEEILS